MASNFTRIWMPGKIRKLEIKNRLCNSPAIPNFSKRNGELTQREHDYYLSKAKGGFGIVFLSATSINGTSARGYVCQPGIYDDRFIEPYKKLTDEIHKYGAKCCVQIYHAGRSTHPMVTGLEANESPTPEPCPMYSHYPGYKVEEMSTQRIREVIQEFADTAQRCKQAGFDIVEIHGAHGYFPQAFLSPFFGKRTIDDGYGPPYTENNFKFFWELIAAIREKCGDDFPVGIRYSVDEFVEGGLTVDDGKVIAKAFEEIGFDYLGVSVGVYTPGVELIHMMVPTGYLPPLGNEPLAAALKEVTSLPLMMYGRISSPEMAEDVLNRGNCDFVQMNRASWVDPELPNKAAEGKEEEIRHCIYCNNGCIDRLWAGLDCTCTMNPAIGMEGLFDKKLSEPVSKKKKVLVIGGGPGGMSCARYAKLRGHDVILCEKEAELGGLVRYSQKGEGREEWEEVTHYYSREIKKLGVEIRMGEAVDVEKVKSISPDAVVVAIGSTPKIPIIKGIKKANGQLADNVITVLDVLGDKKEIGNSVVIVGGTHFGIQAAFYLLGQGKKVTIIESLQELNQDLDGSLVWNGFLMPKLENSEIKILKGTYVQEILPEGVLCGPSGMTPYASDVGPLIGTDAETKIPCDTVVVGAGREPLKNLYQELRGVVPEIYEIGDCVKPRWTYSATGEGARVGINL
ncbi:MAG: FAD-dependent oxidoreductase [Pseudomonadota bacterium]